MENKIKLTVKKIQKETEDSISIIFKNKDLDYIPGQYLVLTIPFENKILNRAYSFSSSPHTDEFPTITIKRVQNGKISNFLNDNILEDNTIISSLPKGKFTTEINFQNNRKITFIAAGSGITPLVSMIKSILKIEEKSSVNLIYINRSENTIIFKEILQKLKSEYKNNFNIKHILTQPNSNWKGISGRPTPSEFKTILKNNTEDEFYICGPIDLMQNIVSTLKELNVAPNNINYESFGSANNKKINKENKNFENSKVKINYEGDIYKINVKPNQTILDAALDEDIDLPFACSSGTCNVCQAKCLKGKVRMENDEGLTDEEINDNIILTCVSKPLSSEIEIEIS